MEQWRNRLRRGTFVLLVTSTVLILPALLGIGASLPFAVSLVLLSGALFLTQEQLGRLPRVAGYDLGWYARDSWFGVLLGAGIVVAFLDASPVEIQALGGIAGLVGMLIYFFRPALLFAIASIRRLTRTN